VSNPKTQKNAELSFPRIFAPGSESTWERKFRVPVIGLPITNTVHLYKGGNSNTKRVPLFWLTLYTRLFLSMSVGRQRRQASICSTWALLYIVCLSVCQSVRMQCMGWAVDLCLLVVVIIGELLREIMRRCHMLRFRRSGWDSTYCDLLWICCTTSCVTQLKNEVVEFGFTNAVLSN